MRAYPGLMRPARFLFAVFAFAGCSSGSGNGQSSLIVSQYTNEGCTDDTQSFLKTYAGTFADSAMTTSMTIGGDGSLSLTENRQVGGTIDGVPYPTECTYDNQGKILGVFTAGSSKQCQTTIGADATAIMAFSVSQISVTPPVSSSCQTFESAMNQKANGGGLTYTVSVNLYDANSFQFEDSGSGPMAGEKMVRK
jgi:hypothetical protein